MKRNLSAIAALRELTPLQEGLLYAQSRSDLSDAYRRENIGLLNKGQRSRTHPSGHVPLCGLSLHSSLVLTPAGLPLGLAAVKFWTRQAFKDTNALKRKINPARVPITEKESLRWLLKP